MDDRYTVDTPENIEFAYDIAGIGSRFLAAIIDGIAILIAQAVVLLAAGLAISSLDLPESLVTAGASILGFLILWGYFLAFEMAWNGQSPGKRVIGLRVVREGGRPITFVASAIRNLVRLVDFLPLFYGIGVVAMFCDRRARRLGDLAAGVLVVRERGDVTLESLTARSAGAAVPASLERIERISALNDSDYGLIQEFLARRSEFSKEGRARLAAQLLRGVERRLELSAGQDGEQFLERVALAYRAHRAAAEQQGEPAASSAPGLGQGEDAP
jgi:uncharacterized RDD family membrane protein YckC